MKILKIAFLAGVLFFVQNLFGQGLNPVIENYVHSYRELAIREMQRTGVPASITLAQGILETQAGTSDLVVRSNNHFGIKCKNWWTGEKVYHDDDERGECFRKYASAEDSYKDHSDYLKNQPRYSFLFQLDPVDYKAWAFGLKKAGYATNPKYSYQLIKYIEDYHLDDYTLIALGKKPYPDDWVVNIGVATVSDDSSMIPKKETRKSKSARNKMSAGSDNRYPEGEFKINKTRVVFVRAGTSLFSIANLYKIKLKRLLEYNDLKPDARDILEKDQLVYLKRKRKQGENDYHIVVPGEDLYQISQEEALRLSSLLQYNQLAIGMSPATGEKLYLRHHAPGRPRLAMAQTSPLNSGSSIVSN